MIRERGRLSGRSKERKVVKGNYWVGLQGHIEERESDPKEATKLYGKRQFSFWWLFLEINFD